MPPLVFMVVTSTVTDLLNDAFQRLPGMVLFAKMIPSNIESSMFAMLTGLMNLSNGFSAKMLGNLINVFVGVEDETAKMPMVSGKRIYVIAMQVKQ